MRDQNNLNYSAHSRRASPPIKVALYEPLIQVGGKGIYADCTEIQYFTNYILYDTCFLCVSNLRIPKTFLTERTLMADANHAHNFVVHPQNWQSVPTSAAANTASDVTRSTPRFILSKQFTNVIKVVLSSLTGKR